MTQTFRVPHKRVARYFAKHQTLLWSFVLVCTLFGIPLIPLVALVCFGGLASKQARALRYRLDGDTLRVDSGVFFLKRKAIPLDRVTDFVMVQGPLMRLHDLWAIQVQTAGNNRGIPEGVLFVESPEEVRDLLVERRDRAAARTPAV